MKNQHVYTTPVNFVSFMIANPGLWKTYLTKCAFSKSAFEQDLPWLSVEAINKIYDRLEPGMKVLEFGGGGSTLFFAKNNLSVTTIESSMEYKTNIESKLLSNNLTNVEVLYRPFDITNEAELRNSKYLNSIPDAGFDIILVDGPEIADYKARPICFEWAEKNIKAGGIIVVDDSWRYPQLLTENNAIYVDECAGIGPGRKGMTKTDIFYY